MIDLELSDEVKDIQWRVIARGVLKAAMERGGTKPATGEAWRD